MSALQRRALAPAFALLSLIAYSAVAQGPVEQHVAGEKLDSGLGRLPHYRDWGGHPGTRHLVVRTHRVTGEKLDNGLGELKHYRYWVDSTGRTRQPVEVASRR